MGKKKHGPVPPDIYWPSEPTLIEMAWGQLFDKQGRPTLRLDQFLRGIANYLIEEYEPRHSLVIGPEKMQKYYREMRIGFEFYAWHDVFDDRTSSISRLYREFNIEYYLIQEERLDEGPNLPAMTPRGFSIWMTLIL